MNLFENFNISNELKQEIKKLGLEKPTEIQEKTIPLILDGKDVIGESSTGSGKTLAFGCGIIEKVNANQGIQALVLTPTRELAEQIRQVLHGITHYKRLNITSIYGGVAIGPQMNSLKNADIVIATPGRLLDHVKRRTIDLRKVKFLVIDEADRMFDMGFIDDVKRIILQCPKQRQTLLFSATISSQISDLSRNYMIDPITISVGKHVDPSKLKQIYYDIQKNMKMSLLVHLLKNEKSGLVMVFCNTRRNTDVVVKNLRANKIDAIAIHGGLSQNKRSNTLNSFNKGRVGVLVCTDVAARGLHIDDVSHIYNYDIPKDPTDYVHRIGRTARAGKEGKVINILCDYDYDNFGRVQGEHRNFKIDKVEKPYIDKVPFLQMDNSRRSFQGNNRRGNHRRNNYRR
ncbi:ATP-dependent RNA helicase [archaeon]|nr:ATP-dependent RNA helicase [archaeon]|tara:strand:+ start:163 stop:1365 length:1203 start_codon:yes stop_codon:yes gene_type:complete